MNVTFVTLINVLRTYYITAPCVCVLILKILIKAKTIKNKDRKKNFHDAGLPSPPDPVITRWATWLRAPLYSGLPSIRTQK